MSAPTFGEEPKKIQPNQPEKAEFSAGGRKRQTSKPRLWRETSEPTPTKSECIGTNKKTAKRAVVLFGCPTSPMRNFSQVHDIIEFSCFSLSRISEVVAPLQEGNLSIADISDHTGFKKTTIWEAQKLQKRPVKTPNAVPYDRWRKGHKRTGARPPYGFCFLLGEVVAEPKEYPVLLLIHKLWKRDESIMSILKRLEERDLKSRTGKVWSYGVIKSIIKRFEAEAIVLRQGKLCLSDDFLKGIILPSNKTKKKRGVK